MMLRLPKRGLSERYPLGRRRTYMCVLKALLSFGGIVGLMKSQREEGPVCVKPTERS